MSNKRNYLRAHNLPYRGTFTGIYVLINAINGRYYIGSSIDVIARISAHREKLRSGKHGNCFLQSDYNKCGENNYSAWFVEPTSEIELLATEQRWINLGFDNQKRCYNISPEAGRNPHHDRKKSHTAINPDGLEVSFTGIREFCRSRGLRFSTFCMMLNEQTPSSQGWRLPKNRNQPIGQTTPKKYDVKLRDPSGIVHAPFTNLEEFCRKHHLRASSVRHLLAGKYHSSKGWTLAN